MLDSTVGITIMNGLFGHSGATQMSFTGNVYLGLLTKLPNANGAAHDDGTYFAEPGDPVYMRVQLDTTSRITGQPFIGGAEADATISVGEDLATPAYITNQGLIIFSEATIPYTIVGFGLFRNNNTASSTAPFLWGPVTSTDGEASIEVAAEEVPVIRAGGFKISFV